MDCQKEKFQLDKEVCYLNGSYMSPLMNRVVDAGIIGLRKKINPFNFGHQEFFDDVIQLKKLYAELMGIHDAGQLAIVPSVSYGLANAAANINPGKKKTIIVAGDQFPSNYYAWEPMIEKYGMNLKIVKAPDTKIDRGLLWNEAIIDAITEDTALLAISHVHWADGTLFQIERMSQKLKEFGGLLAIDGTQSFGAFPFDQRIIKADILVAASYKWLCGPYGIGFAYYSDYFADGVPIENSWLNRKNSEDFSRLVDYQSEFKLGSQRYEMGEAPNFTNVPMATEAVKQLIEWTPSAIQKYCTQITQESIQKIQNMGFWIEDEGYRSAHLFGIRLPQNVNMEALKTKLSEQRIIVSYRGDAIRVSPYVHNTASDLEKLVDILSTFS